MKTDIDKLLKIMSKLRSEDGCPWDKEQNHESLKRFLIEETYEVIETIDNNDMNALKEELGDLLLQVVFHSQLASERGEFVFQDVIDAITTKLLRRHPHVFKENSGDINNPNDVEIQWERIKQKEYEKKDGGKTSILDGVPSLMPSLYQAIRLTEKAARVGFDWNKAEDVIAKIDEEIDELKEAVKNNNIDEIESEFGDVIFALTNFARHKNIDPEKAHIGTLKRFKTRFKKMEEMVKKNNQSLTDKTLDELEELWVKAKKVL